VNREAVNQINEQYKKSLIRQSRRLPCNRIIRYAGAIDTFPEGKANAGVNSPTETLSFLVYYKAEYKLFSFLTENT